MVAAALALAGCGHGMCGSHIIGSERSPDGQLVAYRYLHSCGATTGYSTNVAIGRSGESPAEADVAFTADADHGAALTEGGALWLQVGWTGARRLEVAYPERARLFRHEAAVDGVTISYRVSGPLPPVPPS